MDSHAFHRTARSTRRSLIGLVAVCAALAITLLIGLMQHDDERAAAEDAAWSRGWQQGYDAGLQQRARSVADAYRQGVRDAAIGREVAEGGAP